MGEAKTGEYLDALYARFDWLAENPKLGRARDEIGPGYRSFPEGTHVIFYELGDDGIMITGVPHASMDFGAHFN